MAAKDLTHQDLMALSKRDLVTEAMRMAGKLKAVKDKGKEMALKAKETAAKKAEENADYLAAATGAAAAGYVLGSAQKETDADPEGVDHTTFLGIDKDLALGLGFALSSYFPQAEQYKPHLRQAGIGALSFALGRRTYDYARKPDEDVNA